jgi:putative transposase
MGNELMSTFPSKKSPSYASRGIARHECQTGLVDKSKSIDQIFLKSARLKVRPESVAWLNAAAIEVNQVWNWCAERSLSVYRNTGKRLSGFDLGREVAGCGKHFDHINQSVVTAVCQQYAMKRWQAKVAKLKWRVSFGARRSLGWMPIKGAATQRKGVAFRTCQKSFRVFNLELLGSQKLRDGCFAQDSCGDWWLCLPVEVATNKSSAPRGAVGIDLGLKTIATTSDGETLEAGRWTHAYAERLANAQRRGHKRQAKRIHRKIARCRADALHKFSRKIVDKYQTIVIGDVSSQKFAKTRMAKSVLDSAWGMLKKQLQYKGEHASRSVEIVNERNTTRACSSCGCISGPSGLRQLVVRAWKCSECGSDHDRDINAARNILVRAKALASMRERGSTMNADGALVLPADAGNVLGAH